MADRSDTWPGSNEAYDEIDWQRAGVDCLLDMRSSPNFAADCPDMLSRPNSTTSSSLGYSGSLTTSATTLSPSASFMFDDGQNSRQVQDMTHHRTSSFSCSSSFQESPSILYSCVVPTVSCGQAPCSMDYISTRHTHLGGMARPAQMMYNHPGFPYQPLMAPFNSAGASAAQSARELYAFRQSQTSPLNSGYESPKLIQNDPMTVVPSDVSPLLHGQESSDAVGDGWTSNDHYREGERAPLQGNFAQYYSSPPRTNAQPSKGGSSHKKAATFNTRASYNPPGPSANTRSRQQARARKTRADHIECIPKSSHECKQCSKRFHRVEHLVRHEKSRHSQGANPFFCCLGLGDPEGSCTANKTTHSRRRDGKGCHKGKKAGMSRGDNANQHHHTHLRAGARNKVVEKGFLYYLIRKHHPDSERAIRSVEWHCAKDGFRPGVPDMAYQLSHPEYAEYLAARERDEREGRRASTCLAAPMSPSAAQQSLGGSHSSWSDTSTLI